jgi:hypothetical protein
MKMHSHTIHTYKGLSIWLDITILIVLNIIEMQ